MENINNMSAEMIESKEQTESQKRNGYKVIALILLFIIAALLGAFSYLYVKGNIILKFPLFETQKVIEDKDLETKEEEKKDELTLLTYTYDNPKMPFGFSLEYPENWEITKDKTSCSLDPNTNNEICTGYQLIISLIENPKYSFELDMCSECSPGSICMFSDSDYSDAFLDSSSAYVHRFESFEEFNDGTFRRGVSKEKENDGKLFICKSLNSEEYGNYYHTSILSFIEGIKYTLDENADSQIIEAMDRMVLSLEVIPKP